MALAIVPLDDGRAAPGAEADGTALGTGERVAQVAAVEGPFAVARCALGDGSGDDSAVTVARDRELAAVEAQADRAVGEVGGDVFEAHVGQGGERVGDGDQFGERWVVGADPLAVGVEHAERAGIVDADLNHAAAIARDDAAGADADTGEDVVVGIGERAGALDRGGDGAGGALHFDGLQAGGEGRGAGLGGRYLRWLAGGGRRVFHFERGEAGGER